MTTALRDQVDLNHARQFLTSLDETATRHCFQTFDDRSPADKSLTKVMEASFDEVSGELARLNERGAGIFVTVNETDGRARRKENIRRIRAVHIDLDGSPLEPLLNDLTPPNIVVNTSHGRFHAYWRVTDCPVDCVESALRQMAERFHGDRSCTDRNRVLRLPGFLHRKKEPYAVRFEEKRTGKYTLEDLRLTVPIPTEKQKSFSVVSVVSVVSVGELQPFLPEHIGERNARLFQLARYLKGVFPDSRPEDHHATLKAWHRLALPVIGTQELAVTRSDFLRGWNAIKHPWGIGIKTIVGDFDMAIPIPEKFTVAGYGIRSWRLFQACLKLQVEAGDRPFFLSARNAGALVDLHFTDAAKTLRGFCDDGFLELVTAGQKGKAARYRCTWTVPGGIGAQA